MLASSWLEGMREISSSVRDVAGDGDPTDPDGEPPSDLEAAAPLPLGPGIDSADSLSWSDGSIISLALEELDAKMLAL